MCLKLDYENDKVRNKKFYLLKTVLGDRDFRIKKNMKTFLFYQNS